MPKDETALFVLRRKDTGEYFTKFKSDIPKDWNPDDPWRRHWTKKLELASFYSRKGIKPLRGNVVGDTGAAHGIERVAPEDLEVVRVKVVVDIVVDL